MNLIWLLKKGGKCKHIVDDGVCPLLSVAGLGLMGCWGIIIHYPTLSRPLLWLAHCGNTGLSLVGSDSPPLPAGDRIAWLTGHGRHMRTGGSSHRHIDNILTFFINFSCLLLSTRHLAQITLQGAIINYIDTNCHKNFQWSILSTKV